MPNLTDPNMTSSFLELPIEIRLQIYDYCCSFNGPISIASWSVPAWWPNNIHPKTQRIPGVHRDHMPIARLGFDRSVLAGRPSLRDCECVIAKNTSNIVSMFPEYHDRPFPRRPSHLESRYPVKQASRYTPRPSVYMLPAGPSPSNQSPPFLHPTQPSLHLTCRQIHNELLHHRNLHSERGAKAYRDLDLYLSFPDGVCIVAHRYPHLLHHSRAVYIAGMADLIGIEDPGQVLQSVLANTRPNAGAREKPQSLEEEQAEALHWLVQNVHRLGHRAIATAQESAGQPSESPNPTTTTTTSIRPHLAEKASPNYPECPSELQLNAHTKPRLSLRIIYPASLGRRRSPPPPHPHPGPEEAGRNPYARFALGYAAAAAHDPYRDIWSHNLSPIATAFPAMRGGEIKLSIARSNVGVAVDLVARGNDGLRRYIDSKVDYSLDMHGESIDSAFWNWLLPEQWGFEDDDAAETDDGLDITNEE